ncbi:MAG: 1-acyl-sn-glycerol-3-phosphate acyltransferase [Candidatus Aureabacteria bacterium]|nr:1-acyl-sn-glycerol-3-phosphate acyltransferase [Candidatus Auribacterota bacterium]
MKKNMRYFFYMFTRGLLYLFSLIWFRISIKGKENLPGYGGYIFASNHTSHLDPVFCGLANPWPLYYLAKKELFKIPVFGTLIHIYYSIPIDRAKGDIRAIKIAIDLLMSGKPVLMFPEGTRSEDGHIKEAKRGVGFIVDKAGVPVVPCYIDGAMKALRKNSKVIYPVKIRVLVGRPLFFQDILSDDMKKEDRQTKISQSIIRAIRELKDQLEEKS